MSSVVPGTTGSSSKADVTDLVDAVLSRANSDVDLPAVEHDGVVTTYGEFCRAAFQAAGAVRKAVSAPCPRVLIAIPRSVSAYTGMLGTLLAGGTFCPIDIEGPAERNATIAKLFSPHVILYTGKPPEFLDACPATTPRVDAASKDGPLLDIPAIEYSDIAYVVFTSGSTGQPKGVKIGRQAFSHFLKVSQQYFVPAHGSRWGQFSNLGYDLAVMDVFMALTQGRVLIPLSGSKDRLMPALAIKKHGVNIWQSVPSVLEMMTRGKHVTSDMLGSLRVMSFCGEPLLPRHLETLFAARPDLEVFNTYGATETTGFNTLNRLDAKNFRESCASAFVALGTNVPGWNVQLHGEDVPDEGEIVVSSDWLALGYWADEERTRLVFRDVKSPSGEMQRAYFTGDRGERKDGQLYFKCRHDRQVKVRGERIELDEVDHALREMGFAESFTVFDGSDLHSFVETPLDVDQERVRAILTKKLPFHAVPKRIIGMTNLPRNANGKLDRTAIKKLVVT
ncbi:MAG: AMP-binding protein [Phycisphaerales bacterium]